MGSARAPSAPARTAAPSLPRRRRAPVCCVVDERAVERDTLAALLRACGLRVLSAGSTRDASALLGAIVPDALVVALGARGARDLVAAVRASPDHARTAIVGAGRGAEDPALDLLVASPCAPIALDAVRALARRGD